MQNPVTSVHRAKPREPHPHRRAAASFNKSVERISGAPDLVAVVASVAPLIAHLGRSAEPVRHVLRTKLNKIHGYD